MEWCFYLVNGLAIIGAIAVVLIIGSIITYSIEEKRDKRMEWEQFRVDTKWFMVKNRGLDERVRELEKWKKEMERNKDGK